MKDIYCKMICFLHLRCISNKHFVTKIPLRLGLSAFHGYPCLPKVFVTKHTQNHGLNSAGQKQHRCPNWSHSLLMAYPRNSFCTSETCPEEITLNDFETESQFDDIRTKLSSGNTTGKELVDCVMEVQKARYRDLSNVPWLHTDNAAIAYMQVLMNDKTKSFLSPVLNHEVMQQLLKQVQERLGDIPDEECPILLLSLIYLGIDHTLPLVHRLLDRLLDSVGQMDVPRMARVAETLRSFRKGHIMLIQKMIYRLEELLKAGFESTDGEFIKDFCVLHIYLFSYMSKELSEKLSECLLNILEHENMAEPSHIGSCLRYSRKLHFAVGQQGKEKVLKIARYANQNIPQHLNRLESQHIAEYCHNLKKVGLYKGSLVKEMQQKSLELLNTSKENKTLHIREIVNLSYAFNRDTPTYIKKTLTSEILDNIEDVDVLILSNLADILLDLNTYDPILLHAFQSKTLAMFDNLSSYITRFFKVLRLLTRRPTENEAFRAEFFEKLMKLQESQHGISVWSLSIIAQYILPNVKHSIPHSLMERLLAVIPQCDMNLLSHILDGLNHMQRPWIRQLHNQVLDLRICLQKNIMEKMESVTSVETMIQMIVGLFVRSSRKDLILLERMMAHLPTVTKTLTDIQFFRIIMMMKRLNYYHTEVYEDLVKHLLDNHQDIDSKVAHELVEVLSRTGYTPQNFQVFSDFCIDLLESALETNDIIGQVSLAFDLCQLQIFPDASLSKIFTFEFLEEIDNKLESRPEMKGFLEDLMMKLNRSVVLECPHLDVPWFHEEYCIEKTSNQEKSSNTYSILELEVEQTLCEDLGGKAYYKAGVYSPYYHYINFECVLDREGQPVPNSSSSFINTQEDGYQRVAVLVMHENHYCTNSSHLKGYHLSKHRHLEMLGYKLVLVPHYEWRSMALSDPSERANYLREKICS